MTSVKSPRNMLCTYGECMGKVRYNKGTTKKVDRLVESSLTPYNSKFESFLPLESISIRDTSSFKYFVQIDNALRCLWRLHGHSLEITSYIFGSSVQGGVKLREQISRRYLKYSQKFVNNSLLPCQKKE